MRHQSTAFQMNGAVEMTTNQFQQNISVKLVANFLSTLLSGDRVEYGISS